MARTTRRDWLQAGMKLLLTEGPQGVTIDALCHYVKMTKGSFYHHFHGYEDFKTALLAFYEAEGTLQIIEQLVEVPTPLQKLHQLLDQIVQFSVRSRFDPDVVVRAWSVHDDAVQAVQARVDARRMVYVADLCSEIIGDEVQGERVAQMLYTILVGCGQIQPPITGVNFRTLFNDVLRLYGIATMEEG